MAFPTVSDFYAAAKDAGLTDAATFTPQPGGSPTSVQGKFTAGYSEVLGIESVDPTFRAAAGDLPNVKHGDQVTVASVVYEVKVVMSNTPAQGETTVTLQLA